MTKQILSTLIFLISLDIHASFDIACWLEDNHYGPDIILRVDGENSKMAIDSIKITEDDGDPLFIGVNELSKRSFQIKSEEIPRIFELDYLRLSFLANLDPHTLMRRFSATIKFNNAWTEYRYNGPIEEQMTCKLVSENSQESFNYDYISELKSLRNFSLSKFFF
jgi:hypothetical protein